MCIALPFTLSPCPVKSRPTSGDCHDHLAQRARGLPLFLVPPHIPSIIDFSKLFSLRMICPKYDSCCFFINVSNGLVALISSITDLLVRLAVHGIRTVFSSTTTESCQFFFSMLFLSSRIHNHSAPLGKLMHLLF